MPVTASDFTNFVTRRKVSVDIDLTEDLEGLSRSQRSELKKIVGETFIDEIDKSTARQLSPVNQKGTQQYKPLSKDYKEFKKSQGKGTKANLRLKDQMLNDMFSKNSQEGVAIRITDKLSKNKAENHNHGVTVPKRQYLPTKKGQGFRRDIMKIVNKKIRDYKKSVN